VIYALEIGCKSRGRIVELKV